MTAFIEEETTGHEVLHIDLMEEGSKPAPNEIEKLRAENAELRNALDRLSGRVLFDCPEMWEAARLLDGTAI